MVKLMLRVLFEDNLMSEIGRACLVEIGCKSRWWIYIYIYIVSLDYLSW